MDVILRKPVENLGRAGEIVKVKPGYARNYLIPTGLAYQATEANKQRAAAEAARVAQRLASTRESAVAMAATLAAMELRFTAKSGEGDRLFGSITSADIAARLAESGVEIDKRVIELEAPLKAIGVYAVPIRLHPDVHAELKVWVDKAE
jgi:large subunit ribosomal protein L9